MRDANAVIYLVPGVGMFSFARDKATARIAGEFYVNAINVMREAERVDSYVALPEQQAFDIEYWLLEEAKLQRMPPPKSLAGRVALVTGGAGGIGSATVRRLLGEGACVMLADIDQAALDDITRQLAEAHGADAVRGVICDVTREDSVTRACERLAVEYGGLDILVSNAGIASSAAPLEDTSLELWNRTRASWPPATSWSRARPSALMKRQRSGGAIAFIASKNGMVASKGLAPTAPPRPPKIQLAAASRSKARRWASAATWSIPTPCCAARRSGPANGGASAPRPTSMDEGELEEHYRQRSLLKRNVFPEDIAEAVYFLVSDRSAKSTGNIINVDAGHLAAVHALRGGRMSIFTRAIIDAHNRAAAAVASDYATLGEQLARSGHRHRGDHRARRRLRGGRAELGRGHRRHALRAFPGTRRAAQRVRETRGLRRDPAPGALHTARLAALPLGLRVGLRRCASTPPHWDWASTR
jgi:NAD(P)-dependent dehydrogenase (short-subunit alcohol dehydrogenase family)